MVRNSSQILGHSCDSCTSCVSLSRVPQTMGRQDSTSCHSTSCYSGPFYTSEGADETKREGRKGGTTSGTPFPSDSDPYYCADCKSETKQQQRRISMASLFCVLITFTGRIITQAGRCAQPLTLQLVCRDLYLLSKHSSGYIRMNQNSPNTSYTLKHHDYDITEFLILCKTASRM